MKDIFTLSEHAQITESLYCAKIEQITELSPIEGSNKLVFTTISGFPIVTSNNTKIGDVVIFFPVGSAINKEFLGANNLFDLDSFMLNANANEVTILLKDAENAIKMGDDELAIFLKAQAKSKCGFFNKNCKVRCINLMSKPSQGFILPFNESLEAWQPNLKLKANKFIGTSFDTINYETINEFVENGKTEPTKVIVENSILLCEKFIPNKRNVDKQQKIDYGLRENTKLRKKNKRLDKFDKLIPNQFAFHTKPRMLNDNIHLLTPETVVQISSKWHGTSYITSKILCRRKLTKWEIVKSWFGCKVKKFQYDNIYSSSGIIKNQYIHSNKNAYYNVDIYKALNDIIAPYLDEGMMAYGEAVGYLPDSEKMIQKEYDYGCDVGKFKLIIYRLVTVDKEGNKTEFTRDEINKWITDKLMADPQWYFKNVMALPFSPVYEFYYGKLGDLYPEIEQDSNWGKNVLMKLANDEKFYMEQNCHFCKRFKVPTEGIVVRIENGENSIKCFKLKCNKFYMREGKELDAGIVDIETEESETKNEEICQE